jgi:choice-of-anchor A domain-containing protein
MMSASTLGPLGAAGFDISAYNIVTLSGNLNAGSDIGGAVAVFGNLTAAGSPIDGQLFNTYSNGAKWAMVVDGNDTTSSLTVGNGASAANVWIHGTYSSFNSPTPNITAGQPVTSSPFNFMSAQTYLTNLDGTLASDGTTTYTAPGSPSGALQINGNQNYALMTGAATCNPCVYNVPWAYFTQQNNGFEVDVTNPATQTVIVNVVGAPSTGATIAKGTVIYLGGTQVQHTSNEGVPVLFNFATTVTQISSNGEIFGSILAPNAAYNSNQDVSGQLFVASVTSVGEVHDQYFNGTVPSTVTPEPTTFLTIGGALLVAGIVRKKSARK